MSNSRTTYTIKGADGRYRGELLISGADLETITSVSASQVRTTLEIQGEDENTIRTTLVYKDSSFGFSLLNYREEYKGNLYLDAFFKFSDNTSAAVIEGLVQKRRVTQTEYQSLVSEGKININTWYYVTDALGEVVDVCLGYDSIAGFQAGMRWSDITGKPNTIAGYGIIDAYTKTEVNNLALYNQGLGIIINAKTISVNPEYIASFNFGTKDWINQQLAAARAYTDAVVIETKADISRIIAENDAKVRELIGITNSSLDATKEDLEQTKINLDNARTDLTSKYNENVQRIEQANQTIASARNDLDVARADIESAKRDLLLLDGEVGSVKTSIDEDRGRLQLLESFKSSITGQVNSISVDLDASKALIALNATNINTLDSTIGTVGLRMDAAEGTIEQLTTWKDVANGTLTEVGLRLNSAEGTIDAQASRIDTISGTVSNVGMRMDAAESTIALNASKIDTLNGTIGDVSILLDANTASIRELAEWTDTTDGRITSAERSINASEARITDVISTLDVNTNDVAVLRSEMDGINLTIINQIETQINDNDSVLTRKIGTYIDAKTGIIESSIESIREGTDAQVVSWVGQKIDAGNLAIKTAIEQEIASADYVTTTGVGTIIDGKKNELTNYVTQSTEFKDAATGLITNDINAAYTEWGIDHITSSVVQMEETLSEDGQIIDVKRKFSTIDQQLEQVTIAVGESEEKFSAITVEQNRIANVVSSGSNYAAIVAAINEDNSSSIYIKADKINLDGQVIADRMSVGNIIVDQLTLTDANVYGTISSGNSSSPAWVLRKDGSGSLANGGISWNANGAMFFSGDAIVVETGDPTKDKKLTDLMSDISIILSWFELDESKNAIKTKGTYGFYSNSWISAGGKNSEGGGGGGGGSANAIKFEFDGNGSITTFSTEAMTDGLFDSKKLVMTLYDNQNRVALTDMQILENSEGKYYIQVSFKTAPRIKYTLIVVG